GEKTAAKLITEFGSLHGLLSAARDGKVPTKITARLVDAADYLAVAPTVVRVATDAQIVMSGPDTVPAQPADPDRLAELAQRWGIESSVRRLTDAMAANSKRG
ncbi:MAG TPA: flap endonuclease, partial [Pseudonocardiaceae bacterium]|nr:flap endonuclease [Pseudonocardiaceae bacterium]